MKMSKCNLITEDGNVAKDMNSCNYIFEKEQNTVINRSSSQFELNAWDINLHLLKTRI